MVIEKGFKQTDLGSIPENWNITFLDELIDKTRSIRYGIVQPGKFDPQGRYLVRGQDYSFGWAGPDTLFRVSPSIEEKYKNARLKSGDLVLTIVGASTGHVETVPNWLDGANITQTTARIPIDESKANSGYCKQYLQSSYGWKIVLNFMKGAAQPGLNIGDIRIFKIIIPPLPEQTAIANALSDMDALIAQTEKLIEKKKAIKQGVMQELLKPKEGWVTKKIPEVCWYQEGPGVRKHQFTQNGVKLLNGTNIQFGKLELDNTDKYISENEAYGWYSHFLVNEDDILIACSGVSIDKFHEKVTIAKNNNLPLCMNTSTMRFKIDPKFLTSDFFVQFLKSNYFKEQISGKATGSAQLNFGPSHIKMIDVPFPNFEEQTSIGKTLFDIEYQISKIETKLQKLKNEKQGMMQALLTGKIRLI